MADVRNIVTTVSLAIAVIAGGWAFYVSQYSGANGSAITEPAGRSGSGQTPSSG